MATLTCLAPVGESTISIAITVSMLKFVVKKSRIVVNISQIEYSLARRVLDIDPSLIALSTFVRFQ